MTVQAVQNFTTNNFKANSTNYDAKGNVMSKMDNSKSVADSFTKSNQVAFKGNLAKAGENLLGDAGSKIGGKVRRFGEEATEVIGGAFRKLIGKNELPITEKPILSPNRYDDRTIDLLNKLKENDVDISGIGSIDRSVNGGLQSIDKSLINGKIDQALKNGDITSDTARSLKSDVSMCGNPHDGSLADDISGSSLGDDVSGGYDGGGVDGGDFDCDSGDIDPSSFFS